MKTRPFLFALLPSCALFAADPAKPVVAKPAGEPGKPARRTLAQLAEDKRVLAAELVQLMRVEKQLEVAINDMHAGLDAQIDQGLAGPAASQRPLVEEYRKKIHAIIAEGMDWKNLKSEVVKAHADSFSEEELKALVEFFKSPVGRSFAEKSDKVTAAVGALSRQRMQAMQPRIQSSFYELNLRLQQALQGQQGAPGTAAQPVRPAPAPEPDPSTMPVER